VRRGDRLDDADRLAAVLQHGALLDVQLHQRGDPRRIDPRLLQPVRVEAGPPQRLGHADPVAIAQAVEVGAAEVAGRGAAAHAPGPEPGLLPRPCDDLDRAPRRRARLAQQVHRGDRAEDADHAVVAAGVERRVDVRAGQHQRGIRVAPRPAAEQVADGVEPRLEARLAHPAGDPLQRGGVGRRVNLPRDPARSGVVVEARQLGDRVVQPCGGDHARSLTAPRTAAHQQI
jgi:hypothetical protein